MIPVLTPAEMAAVDAEAPEPVEVLIGRAGAAVATAALRMLGGGYGRRVTVVAGKGNNGNDGRDAALRLRRRGVAVSVVDAADAPGRRFDDADLVVDAAYGTGFRGEYEPPAPPEAPVLAVDVPSGVDGATGVVRGGALAAARTVTFAALKPGLVLDPGRALAGEVEVADIGLSVERATVHVAEAHDVAAWVPRRAPTAHKWHSGLLVVAGSPTMWGAAHLVAAAAQRGGAGMVLVGSPGQGDPPRPTEAVAQPLPATGWAPVAIDAARRCRAAVVGPGLGTGEGTRDAVREVVARLPVPVVIDGDGLSALGTDVAGVLRLRPRPTVLTPHDGEFQRLAGSPPGEDRIDAARALASRTRAVVLLKGRTTVVADPDGRVLLVLTGDERLATAGTGDVLSGLIGALLAAGAPAFEGTVAAAWLHGSAGRAGPPEGMVASDLLRRVPLALAAATAGRRTAPLTTRTVG